MTTPWALTGIDISNESCKNIATAFSDAGVNFNVVIEQGYYRKDSPKGAVIKTPDHYFIVREDTGDVLGHCRRRYKVYQNSSMCLLAEQMVATGKCCFDTAGVLSGGAKVWLLLKLILPEINIGTSLGVSESMEFYLLMVNGHDGVTPFSMGVLPVRPACTNMFPRLVQSHMRMKHTSQIESRIGSQLEEMKADILPFVAKLQKMHTCGISTYEWEKYVQKLIPKRDWKRCYTPIPHNWYIAYNNILYYYNYVSGRSAATRLTSLWFGKNNKILRQALELAYENAIR